MTVWDEKSRAWVPLRKLVMRRVISGAALWAALSVWALLLIALLVGGITSGLREIAQSGVTCRVVVSHAAAPAPVERPGHGA